MVEKRDYNMALPFALPNGGFFKFLNIDYVSPLATIDGVTTIRVFYAVSGESLTFKDADARFISEFLERVSYQPVQPKLETVATIPRLSERRKPS